jgi:carboxyl-terminal processing protease
MQEQTKNRDNKGIINKVIIALAMVLIAVISFVGGYFLNFFTISHEQRVASEIVRIINSVGYVVDPSTGEIIDLSDKQVANSIVRTYLDRYSTYYTAEEYARILSEDRGNRSGVGLSFYSAENKVDVVLGNSPAEKAGIKKGDKIVGGRVDGGERVQISNSTQVIEFLSSSPSQATLTLILSRGEEELEVDLKKSEFKVSYVTYYDSQMKMYFNSIEPNGNLEKQTDDKQGESVLDDQTAHIVFNLFEGDASSQIKSALEFMKERGRSKLILDLRNNGGGLMRIFTDICGYFVNQKEFVVASTKGKEGEALYKCSNGKYFDHVKDIVVLANENTASAAECLIGVLCHYRNGGSTDNVVVEKNANGIAKTYGKGIMQTTYSLWFGGAFKLTTAKIYWPDKTTSIHGTGVVKEGLNAAEKGQALKNGLELLAQRGS